ncbi:MAG: diheme cytochrome c-553 [candidate division Zixibacteria bacterium]|nr:diheme cytochrome c-553 [candidate division Zixibacteria bacterium]
MKIRMAIVMMALGLIAVAITACNHTSAEKSMSQDDLIARGEHLVRVGDCGICHTPKTMTERGPVEDSAQLFAGHLKSDPIPEYPAEFLANSGWMAATNPSMTAWAGPWGISFATNLTPHQVYGCGAWTETAFINAMRNGKHLGNGRPILPPMPWQAIGHHTEDDLKAMFAYFKSIKPIENQVPQPVPPLSIEKASTE